MQYKAVPCRNFQRGSCQYGERCKFLHVIQQQPKSHGSSFGAVSGSSQQQKANPFGFGSAKGSQQQQNSNPFGFGSSNGSLQQKNSNPFGFGVQNSSQPKGTSGVGRGQNQFKPFENKWTRSSSSNSDGASRQSANQAVNHTCTDPKMCKHQIAEDLQNERPLWKLTCYSHCKDAPCDIVGDISFEELRAAAYDDAKHGMSLQSIVERESNLLNSKLAEFQNLLQKPFSIPPTSSLANHNPHFGSNATELTPAAPPFSHQSPSFGPSATAITPTVPSFANNNPSFGPSASALTPATSSFTNHNPSFGPSATIFTHTSTSFANHNPSSGPGVTAFTPITPNQNGGPQPVPSFSQFGQSLNMNSRVSNTISQAQPSTSVQSFGNKPGMDKASCDLSVWLKEKWCRGEIPEEAPPDSVL